jgi:putative transcriptional regulator
MNDHVRLFALRGPTYRRRVETTWSFDPRSVADALRKLRTRQGYTQADLAERAGLAYETISRIESGREPPSLRTAVQLANAFGVPVDELIGRSPAPTTAGKRAEHEHRQKVLREIHESIETIPTELLEDLQRIVRALGRGGLRRKT